MSEGARVTTWVIIVCTIITFAIMGLRDAHAAITRNDMKILQEQCSPSRTDTCYRYRPLQYDTPGPGQISVDCDHPDIYCDDEGS